MQATIFTYGILSDLENTNNSKLGKYSGDVDKVLVYSFSSKFQDSIDKKVYVVGTPILDEGVLHISADQVTERPLTFVSASGLVLGKYPTETKYGDSNKILIAGSTGLKLSNNDKYPTDFVCSSLQNPNYTNGVEPKTTAFGLTGLLQVNKSNDKYYANINGNGRYVRIPNTLSNNQGAKKSNTVNQDINEEGFTKDFAEDLDLENL